MPDMPTSPSPAGSAEQPTTAPPPARSRRLGGAARVWCLNGGLLAVLGLLFVARLARLGAPHNGIHLPWWTLAIGFALAEAAVVHVELRRQAHSFAIGELILTVGLFVAAPRQLVAAQALGAFTTLALHRRQRPLKLVFNLAQFCLSSAVASLVFQALHGHAQPQQPRAWAAAVAGVLAASLVSFCAITVAIALSGDPQPPRELLYLLNIGLAGALANTSLGLTAAAVASDHPGVTTLLLPPVFLVLVTYRAYLRQRDQRHHLEFLLEATRALHGNGDLDDATVTMLRQVGEALRAEQAELVLFSADSGADTGADAATPLQATASATGATGLLPVPAEATAAAVASLRTGPALLIPGRDPEVDAFLTRRGWRNGLSCPLRTEGRLVGLLVLGNRLSEVGHFDDDDLRLLESVANQVSAALETDRLEHALRQIRELKEQLEYQAFHDPLTGLANRTLFTRSVAAALHGASDRPVAVLFCDLDDFKRINDTLGHGPGDELLVAVGQRLRSCLDEHDIAARFGGDEFAVLVPSVNDERRPVALAERLIARLAQPLTLAGETVRVSVSIGIVVTRPGEEELSTLLRHADLAMYEAKRRGKNAYEMFRPSLFARAKVRHQLIEALAEASLRDELEVHYQPYARVTDGRAAGVEALVRWRHPVRGLISPNHFISLAEEAGHIGRIGEVVLSSACAQMAAWHRQLERSDLTVNVNLSVAQLLQPELIGLIDRTLEQTGLAPDCLLLEITESVLVADAQRAREVMTAIRQRGVRWAIDDFGTGYSSLSYLWQLPIETLKLPRELVGQIDASPDSARFLEALVTMGKRLGFTLVAEGVERPAQLRHLREMDVDLAQGYLLSRPKPAAELVAHLAKPLCPDVAPASGESTQLPAPRAANGLERPIGGAAVVPLAPRRCRA